MRHLARTDPRSDRDLLAQFVDGRDDCAFAELVRRHGPVVLAACRRGTGNHHDANDAYQAVFLTLARRAASIQKPDLLGHWLYQVSVRVAWRARRAASRRRAHEVLTADVPEPVAPPPSEFGDLGPVLDEELARLPAWHRDAVVLCDLQGLARADAAARLGVPLGTLASRLDKARKKLAAGLTRRGVTLTAAVVPGVLADLRAAAVPASLLDKACGLATGAVPRVVLQLAHRGMMMRTVTTAGLVAASLALVGVGLSVRPGGGQTPVAPPPRAVADTNLSPQDLVLRAWAETAAGLKSGAGEGVYEETFEDGRTFRYAVNVVHAGPKFRAELARIGDGRAAPLRVPALVTIYDGETVAYRELPIAEEAQLVPASPDEVHRRGSWMFRLNPARLPTAAVDLPDLLRTQRRVTFTRDPDGVTAAYDHLTARLQVRVAARFPRAVGYNPGSVEFVYDGGDKQVVTLAWARSNGVWYVRELEWAWSRAGVPKESRRLTYAAYEANAAVDPGRFRLPALGLSPNRRLRYTDEAAREVEFYYNVPPAPPERPGDTLLDGLRRLPRAYVTPRPAPAGPAGPNN
jgi:RNA polymerase sigma factor (sigma-70 family)